MERKDFVAECEPDLVGPLYLFKAPRSGHTSLTTKSEVNAIVHREGRIGQTSLL
jgi:hypothetical protein